VIYVIEYVSKESKEKSLESEEFFLFETDVSFKLPKLCLPYDSSCAVINGFIYVLNKSSGGIDRYDPISNLWKKFKSSYIRLNSPEMVSLRSELYVIEGGGEKDENKGENRLMKYDPIADEWTQRASLNKNRRGLRCTVFNRMLYVVGGDGDFSHPVAYVDRYDPLNNQWTSLKPMMKYRRRPGVC